MLGEFDIQGAPFEKLQLSVVAKKQMPQMPPLEGEALEEMLAKVEKMKGKYAVKLKGIKLPKEEAEEEIIYRETCPCLEEREEHVGVLHCTKCYDTGNINVPAAVGRLLYGTNNIEVNHYKTQAPYSVRLVPGHLIESNGVQGPPVNEATHADIMIIGSAIDELSAGIGSGSHFYIPNQGEFLPPGAIIDRALKNNGIDPIDYSGFYYTSALKFVPPGRKGGTISVKYFDAYRFLLAMEIEKVKPKVILTMGADATKALMGNRAKVSTMEGAILRLGNYSQLNSVLYPYDTVFTNDAGEEELVAPTGPYVIPTLSTRALVVNSYRDSDLYTHTKLALAVADKGPVLALEEASEARDYRYLETIEGVWSFVEEMKAAGHTKFAVDCEWGGRDWRSGYLRSIQISWGPGTGCAITFYKEDHMPTPIASTQTLNNYPYYIVPAGVTIGEGDNMQLLPQDSFSAVCDQLNWLLNVDGVQLMGHSIRADLPWMIKHLNMAGTEDRVYFDTMLAHHVINCTLPHGLTYCANLHTDLGMYDLGLENYKRDAKVSKSSLEIDSYGMIPYDILSVYSVKDVDATFQLYEYFKVELAKDKGYTSVFYDVVMPVTPAILEMEIKGVHTDRNALINLVKQYNEATESVLAALQAGVDSFDFNPRSPAQVQKVLFGEPLVVDGVLVQYGLVPVKSTGKLPMYWEEVVEDPHWDETKSCLDQESFSPSTDADTVEVLVGLLSGVPDADGNDTDNGEKYVQYMRLHNDYDVNLGDAVRVKEFLKNLDMFKLLDQMKKNFTSPPDAIAKSKEDIARAKQVSKELAAQGSVVGVDLTEPFDFNEGYYSKGLLRYYDENAQCIATTIGQMTDTGRYTCVAGWTEIETDNGYVPIKDIAVGTNVFTHKGRYQPVLETQIKGIEEMYDITFDNGQTLTCTAKHKLLTAEGKWLAVKEAIDECFTEMGGNWKSRRCDSPLPGREGAYDGRNSRRSSNHNAQCIMDSQDAYGASGVQSPAQVTVHEFEDGREESHERQVRGPASPLEGGNRRRLRLPNQDAQREEAVCSSNSDGEMAGEGRSESKRATIAYSSTSCGRGSPQQCYQQLSPNVKRCTQAAAHKDEQAQETSGRTGEDFIREDLTVSIIAVNYRGCQRVYDITVDVDHSYFSAGVFSHNSSKPNLQNLPKMREKPLRRVVQDVLGGQDVAKLRSIFRPRGNKILIEADYTTAEVYVLAYLSKDKVLEEDAAKDIHSRNAVALLGADEYEGYDAGEAPSGDWKHKFGHIRGAAKSITFGIPYGKGPASMAREIQKAGLECTVDDAARYIKAWKDKYKLAAQFLLDSAESATGGNWEVRTPFGRRRRFPPTTNQRTLAAYGREACNMPIQGTVGDLLSLALIALYNYRREHPECPEMDVLLVVHDAILVECDPADIKEVNEILRMCMGPLAKIPGTDNYLEVDSEYSLRWCDDLPEDTMALINQIA